MLVAAKSKIVPNGASAIMAADDLGLFVGTGELLGDKIKGGIYFSSDCGETWQIRVRDLYQVRCFSRALFGQANLFSNSTGILVSTFSGIFFSTNGKSWKKTALSKNLTVYSILDLDGQFFLLGATEGAFRLDDRLELTEIKLARDGGHYNFIAEATGTKILAYNQSFVYESSDQGVSWQQVVLPPGVEVRSLLVQPKTADLWLGTDKGLFRRLHGQSVWEEMGAEVSLSKRRITSQVWHHDCLFVSTSLYVFGWSPAKGWQELWNSADYITELACLNGCLFVLAGNTVWRLELQLHDE